MAVMSSSSLESHGDHWFPTWFIWPLFVLTSAIRVYYVMQPGNWWIVHPDEVYQTMEVAHAEVYGYGFRAYEFNPPWEITPQTPDIRRQDMDHGMAALRSYLLPHAYVMITWCLQSLGFDFAPFVTWKVAHTIFASTLLLSVYHYVIVIFRSRDIACLAAILCAACAQLHVLGTHTLTNSVLAPPVFLCLARLHMLISPSPDEADAEKAGKGSKDDDETKVRFANRETMANGSAMIQSVPNVKHQNSRKEGKQKQSKHGTSSQLSSHNSTTNKKEKNNCLQNGDTTSHNSPARRIEKNTGMANGDIRVRYSLKNKTDMNVYLANGHTRNGLGGTTIPEVTCNGQAKTTKDSNVNGLGNPQNSSAGDRKDGTPQLANASIPHLQNTTSQLTNKQSLMKSSHVINSATACLQDIAAGFILGVCAYIRVDVVALTITSLLPHWSPFCTSYHEVIISACGGVTAIGVGVLYDFWCYGWGVITPYNWYKFNVANDYSSLVFGSNVFHKYIVDIFFQNPGMTALTLISCVCCVLNGFWFLYSQCSKQTLKEREQRKKASDLSLHHRFPLSQACVSWALLLVVYSNKGHKELRFIHNVIVLVLMTCAAVLQSNVKKLSPSLSLQRLVMIVGVVFFTFSQWQDVISLTDSSKKDGNKFAFKMISNTQDLNECLYFLSSRPDLTGVFIDRNLYCTGGYSLLHKDVPVFSNMGKNFHEYLLEDRLMEPAKTKMGQRRNISVSYVGQFSNFLSKHSIKHVMPLVLKSPHYNYFVVHAHHNFSIILGQPLFSCGKIHVYHRLKTLSQEQHRIIQLVINRKPQASATILMHEADMLFYHGAWARAAERFELTLKADPSLVGAYLPMAAAYNRSGDKERFQKTLQECYKKFGRPECEKKRTMLVNVSDDSDLD